MSYITPAQFRAGMQQAKDYTDSAVQNSGGGSGGGGFSEAYIVGSTPFAEDWLSGTEGGTAITPESGDVRVVMTEGEHSRMLYKYDGTKWVPVGAKVNFLPYMSDIVRNVGYVGVPSNGATIEVLRFRPADKTTKITIKCSYYAGTYGGSGVYGIENVEMRSGGNSRTINETFTLEEGQKENDFIIRLTGGSPYSAAELPSVSNCVVTESNEKYEYTYNLTTKTLFNNETHEAQAGLVPAIPDEVGESGVLLSDGAWHTKESAAEILDELPITQQEIKQTFEESYGKITPTGDIYSLEEQVIGRWIDGKPLYRKVMSGTSPSASGDWQTGLTNIDYAMIKELYIASTLNYRANKSYINFFTTIKSDGSSIYFDYVSGDHFKNRQFTAIVEYTKTTDSPTTP